MKKIYESASSFVRWLVVGLLAAITALPTFAAINASI